MEKEKASQDRRISNSSIPAGEEDAQVRELSAEDMESASGGNEVIPPEWIMRDE